jgi:hypothetical protein
MASKTAQITLNPTWQRIDGSELQLVGKVVSGFCQIEYCTSEPAAGDLGVPFGPGEQINITVIDGDQVWAKTGSGSARLALFRSGAE